MNILMTLQCDTCDAPTNCRIGLSNRDEQPLRFCCQTCGSPVDINLTTKAGDRLVGAHELARPLPFDTNTSFVDLHLDFPVSFDPYRPGATPFMVAFQRIGPESIRYHSARLNFLNQEQPKFRLFALLLKLYVNAKFVPFRSSLKRNFGIDLRSDRPEDINHALFDTIARMMIVFSALGDDQAAQQFSMSVIRELLADKHDPFGGFIRDIISTGLLKNLHVDCLGIYPEILKAELPLRPALFLDFDDHFRSNPVPMRISNEAFETYRDLYKDISEILARQMILVAGVNNIQKRNDHNKFAPRISGKSGKDTAPQSLHAFADMPFGLKNGFLDDSWFVFDEDDIDNKLRNAIAHHKTEYDDVNQIVRYFPTLEGMKQQNEYSMTFLQFLRRLLASYRALRRLHIFMESLLNCYFRDYQDKSSPTKSFL